MLFDLFRAKKWNSFSFQAVVSQVLSFGIFELFAMSVELVQQIKASVFERKKIETNIELHMHKQNDKRSVCFAGKNLRMNWFVAHSHYTATIMDAKSGRDKKNSAKELRLNVTVFQQFMFLIANAHNIPAKWNQQTQFYSLDPRGNKNGNSSLRN